MNIEKYINLKEAAAIAGISPSLFIYYLKKPQSAPPYDTVAGCRVFEPKKIEAWSKNRHLFLKLNKEIPEK